MTPEPAPAFEARCRLLCGAGFRATGTLPARKSEVITGVLDGMNVVAKRLARPNDVWAWYLAREIAIYRAFAAEPPPIRVPRLVAAADDVLVVEHLGEPLAQRRSPQITLDDATLQRLLAMHEQLARWRGAFPTERPPPAVLAQLRARFLEDPTAPVEWVRDGLARAARRGIVPGQVVERIVLDGTTVPSHGDLLLRNAVGDGLADWECAGPYLADWDLALLAIQLAPAQRPRVEAAARHPATFRALVVFALVREIAILQAFRASPRRESVVRFQRELAEACDRV